ADARGLRRDRRRGFPDDMEWRRRGMEPAPLFPPPRLSLGPRLTGGRRTPARDPTRASASKRTPRTSTFPAVPERERRYDTFRHPTPRTPGLGPPRSRPVEDKDLERHIRVVRDLREERRHPAAGGVLHDLRKARSHPVLEHRSRLAHLHERAFRDHLLLDRREAVFQPRHDHVLMDQRARAVGTAPIVLPVHRRDAVRDRSRLALEVAGAVRSIHSALLPIRLRPGATFERSSGGGSYVTPAYAVTAV